MALTEGETAILAELVKIKKLLKGLYFDKTHADNELQSP